MSRVINYLETSFWTMRAAEFGTMLRTAYAHAGDLDAVLSRADVVVKEKPEAMLARTGTRLDGTRYVEMREGVGVIDVNGIIAKRMDMFDEMCFGGTSTEKLLKDFTTALNSPNVDSIVLNIDSPGGEAFGINELAQAIYDARGKKPIKAYISGLGCSGAYWIAASASEIVADKSAFLGSIGVVTAWTDDKEFYKNLGIRREVVTSTNAPFKRLDFDNEEHRAELQRELDSIESVFHKFVAKGRGVSVEKVKSDFNQGGVRLGADAVKAGMADRVGSLEDVIKSLQSQKKKESAVRAEGDIDMSFREKFQSFVDEHFSTSAADEPTPGDGAEVETPVVEPEVPETTAPEGEPVIDASAQLAHLQEQLAASHKTAASAFVETEIQAGRMLPYEREQMTSMFIQAATDDTALPLASGSRVASLKAVQAARKPHGFNEEKIDANSTEKFILGLNSERSQMQKDADAQVSGYVATNYPKEAARLEVVK